MKRIAIAALAAVLFLVNMITVFAADSSIKAAGADSAKGKYTVVSAVSNREYSFKENFYVSCDEYETDPNKAYSTDIVDPDVTITLRNNETGIESVYKKDAYASYTLFCTTAIVSETTELDAILYIADLGGDYGISDVEIPTKITVTSDAATAKAAKYDTAYFGEDVQMVEDKDFICTVDGDDIESSDVHIRLLNKPELSEVTLHNVEAMRLDTFTSADAAISLDDTFVTRGINVLDGFFAIPGKVTLSDGSVYPFYLPVTVGSESDATPDSPSKVVKTETKDSAAPNSANSNAIQTGANLAAIITAGVLMVGAALCLICFMIRKKRRT